MSAPNNYRAHRTGRAWAVVDATSRRPIHACDIESSRAAAVNLKRLRQTANFPIYPGAKWKVIPITINERIPATSGRS